MRNLKNVVLMLAVVGCGQSETIIPEPTSTSGTGGTTTTNGTGGQGGTTTTTTVTEDTTTTSGTGGTGGTTTTTTGSGGAGGVMMGGGEQSGSRLRIKYRVGDDGTKVAVLSVLFDSMLGTDCVFQEAADGIFRCAPFPSPFAFYFSDAACTKRVAAVAIGCPAPVPKYVSVSLPGAVSGCNENHIHAIGAKWAGATYFDAGGTCTALSLPANNEAYEVGAEVPPASFVGSTVQVD